MSLILSLARHEPALFRDDTIANVKTILVADDKDNVRQLLKDFLSQQGYRVLTARDGREALLTARHEKPDLVVLDVMMPELDGYQFIPLFRRDSNAPIILLTAKIEENDKVLGLELGADDYVTKPFAPRELLARIRAALRRADPLTVPSQTLRAGDLTLNRDTHLVTLGDRVLDLTPTEFDLLAVLMSAPARVFSRQNLLDQLSAGAMVERTIDVHIKNLRSKIEPDPASPRYIETVFGVGYRFRAE